MSQIAVLGTLLLAASPIFSQVPAAFDPRKVDGGVQWFTLHESRGDILKLLGAPKLVLDLGLDFESWQYEVEPSDEEEPSHILVFRKSTGQLISVTRNYSPERTVDEWFSAAAQPRYFPNNETPALRVRIEKRADHRVWLAIGADKPGKLAGQVLLIDERELPRFYPWLASAE